MKNHYQEMLEHRKNNIIMLHSQYIALIKLTGEDISSEKVDLDNVEIRTALMQFLAHGNACLAYVTSLFLQLQTDTAMFYDETLETRLEYLERYQICHVKEYQKCRSELAVLLHYRLGEYIDPIFFRDTCKKLGGLIEGISNELAATISNKYKAEADAPLKTATEEAPYTSLYF